MLKKKKEQQQQRQSPPKRLAAAVAAVFATPGEEEEEEEVQAQAVVDEQGHRPPHHPRPPLGKEKQQKEDEEEEEEEEEELLPTSQVQALSFASTHPGAQATRPPSSPPTATTAAAHARADALREEGNARALAGDFRKGLELFEEALGVLPRSAILWELKAQSHLQVCEHLEAVKAARRAVDLNPDWGDAALTLGRALLSLGEVRPAVGVLSALLGKEPGNSEVRSELIYANDALLELRRREDDFDLQLSGRAGLSKQEEEVARAKRNLLLRGANVSSDCFLGGSEGSSVAMGEGDEEEEEDMEEGHTM